MFTLNDLGFAFCCLSKYHVQKIMFSEDLFVSYCIKLSGFLLWVTFWTFFPYFEEDFSWEMLLVYNLSHKSQFFCPVSHNTMWHCASLEVSKLSILVLVYVYPSSINHYAKFCWIRWSTLSGIGKYKNFIGKTIALAVF